MVAMNTITFWTDRRQATDLIPHYLNQSTHRGNTLSELQQYIKSFGPVPNRTSYLGTCYDGLPLFLDLADPTPGSLLLIGSDEISNTRFIKTILASSMMINSIIDLKCSVISPNVGNYYDLTHYDHMEKLLSAFDSAAHKYIVDLAILAEQRRNGRHTGVTHILFIEDLAEIMKYDDFETENHLSWLTSNGPRNAIWVLASIDRQKVEKIGKKMLQCFGTYIFSDMNNNEKRMINHSGNFIEEFSTRLGSETLNFYLPMLE